MPYKGESYRRALQDDPSSPEADAYRHHIYLTEREKLNRGYAVNIWDAARAFRETHSLGDTGLRAILKEPEFRSAWQTFRYERAPQDSPKEWFKMKREADRTIWGRDDSYDDFIERLRSTSP